ncbi:MAG: hypothetical protein GX333_07715 [Syntrophomonadaceae bacterium]|nr:hypothetical protein [Syntrophomonadaceae bacterium]
MRLKLVAGRNFAKGDLVRINSNPKEEHFCIIAFKKSPTSPEPIAILKALFNDTYIIEKPVSSLISLLVKGKL